MAAPTLQQLTDALLSQSLPHPHTLFLTPILTTTTRLPPLQALAATAKHRLLSSDITQPNILDPSKALPFPLGITDVKVASRVLSNDVCVQVLQIEDLGRSKWEQIEALESERKGETTKGREIIRVVAAAEDGQDASSAATQVLSTAGGGGQAQANKSHGPFKLLMQDVKGQVVSGFELKRVEKIGYPGGSGGMSIGCKIMLRKGCKVSRGMVLLEPGYVVVLGGRIEGLDKAWREGREKALRDAVGDGQRRDGDGDPD